MDAEGAKDSKAEPAQKQAPDHDKRGCEQEGGPG
jgi:hypothetical protein